MTTWLYGYAALLLAAWRKSLIAGLPVRLLDALGLRPQLGIFCASPLVALRRRRGGASPVDIERLSARQIAGACLIPPDEIILRRTMRLPAAALKDLEAIVVLDIPVSTPFEAEEVHFAASPVGSAGNGQLDVALALVPKTSLEPWLAKFDSLGRRPSRLWLGPDLIVETDSERREKRTAALRLDLLFLALAITLAGLTCALAFSHQADDLQQVRTALSRVIVSLDLNASLHKKLESARQRLAFLPQRRMERPSPLAALATASAALAGDLRLEGLSLHGRDLIVTLSSPLGRPPDNLVSQFGRTMFDPGYSAVFDTNISRTVLKGKSPVVGKVSDK